MTHLFLDVFKDTLMITTFVLVIMLFIEILNISTQGNWHRGLSRSPRLQTIVAALLGLIPGCFGGFAVVSMYSHGILHSGALLAAMITSIGDESFVMLVQMPEKTLMILAILFTLALPAGFAARKLFPRISPAAVHPEHLVLHQHEQPGHIRLKDLPGRWKKHLLHPSFARALLAAGLVGFIILLAMGGFEHGHDMPHEMAAGPSTGLHLPLEERWFNYVFLVLALAVLMTVLTVSEHFLEHHLWEHVIRKHFLKIFLWTLAALALVHLLEYRMDALNWINRNPYVLLLLAVAVGLIPESGPHLIFVGLFLGGHIPFCILLANALVQDGHSSLPLFAEDKKAFVVVKGIKMSLALLLGGLGLLL